MNKICPITDELINEIRDNQLQEKQELIEQLFELKSLGQASKGALRTMLLPEIDPLIDLCKMCLSLGIYIGYKIKEKEVDVQKLNELINK